jgi:hypothetical protein
VSYKVPILHLAVSLRTSAVSIKTSDPHRRRMHILSSVQVAYVSKMSRCEYVEHREDEALLHKSDRGIRFGRVMKAANYSCATDLPAEASGGGPLQLVCYNSREINDALRNRDSILLHTCVRLRPKILSRSSCRFRCETRSPLMTATKPISLAE